jgi:enamine deaminase RidA (YjgF/YER057c/UK114 family)
MEETAKKEIIDPGKRMHPLPWPYSHAVKVGNLLFVAGQVALDEELRLIGIGDPEAQARQVWRNIQTVVEAGGGKITDVVRVTTYLADASHLEAVHRTKREFFPAGTTRQPLSCRLLALAAWLLRDRGFRDRRLLRPARASARRPEAGRTASSRDETAFTHEGGACRHVKRGKRILEPMDSTTSERARVGVLSASRKRPRPWHEPRTDNFPKTSSIGPQGCGSRSR